MNHRHFYHCLLIALSILTVACGSNNTRNETVPTPKSASNKAGYDSLTAKKYGADEYGMKKYVMAFLKKGPNRNLDSAKAAALQKAHLENIMKLAEAEKLVLAGPFLGAGDLRGIYIFNVESVALAEELTNTDPAIQAGSLVMELKEWYGSAALLALNDIHKTLAQKSITGE